MESKNLIELAKEQKGFLAFSSFLVIAMVHIVQYLVPKDSLFLLLKSVEPNRLYNFFQSLLVGVWIFGVILLYISYKAWIYHKDNVTEDESQETVESSSFIQKNQSDKENNKVTNERINEEDQNLIILSCIVFGLFFSMVGFLFGTEAAILNILGTALLFFAYGLKTNFIQL